MSQKDMMAVIAKKNEKIKEWAESIKAAGESRTGFLNLSAYECYKWASLFIDHPSIPNGNPENDNDIIEGLDEIIDVLTNFDPIASAEEARQCGRDHDFVHNARHAFIKRWDFYDQQFPNTLAMFDDADSDATTAWRIRCKHLMESAVKKLFTAINMVEEPQPITK